MGSNCWMDGWMDVGRSVGRCKKYYDLIGRHKICCLVIGYNVSEMSNEWGAYAGVLPQTGFCT